METQIVNTDTLVRATEVVGSIIPLFVWVVGGMAVAIVAMAFYIVTQQKALMKIQKESTIAFVNHTTSNNNLANAIGDLKMVVYNKKGK